MKKTIAVLALSITALTLTACNKPSKEDQPKSTEAPASTAASTAVTTADNTETSLDWAGEYKGVFPCADCEGIKTELELKSDKTYELTEEYLGGKTQSTKSIIKGTFSFDSGSPVITLDQAAENRKFFVGENFVEARNIQTGEALDSKLNYKLQKDIH